MPKAPNLEVFRKVGQNVAKQRYGKDLSQTRFSKDLQITRTSLALIESGKQGLTLPRLYQIAHALGIDVSVLLPPVSEIFPSTQKTPLTKPEVPGLKDESVQELENILLKKKGREYHDEASDHIGQKNPSRSRRGEPPNRPGKNRKGQRHIG